MMPGRNKGAVILHGQHASFYGIAHLEVLAPTSLQLVMELPTCVQHQDCIQFFGLTLFTPGGDWLVLVLAGTGVFAALCASDDVA
jgi:hypothetical protein